MWCILWTFCEIYQGTSEAITAPSVGHWIVAAENWQHLIFSQISCNWDKTKWATSKSYSVY